MTRIYAAAWVLLATLAAPCAVLGQITIEGRIKTEDGRLPEHMRVFLLDSMYQQRSMSYVDAGGRFRFQAPSKETYYVQVEAAGTDYEPQTVRVETMPNPYSKSSRENLYVDVLLRIKDSIKRSQSPPLPGSSKVLFSQVVPQQAREAYEKASQSLSKNDTATALTSLKRALEIFPDYFDALETLGSEYLKVHNYVEAIPLLRRALLVNNNGWRCHYALGVALTETNRREEGIAELRHAVELSPESPNSNMRLGVELAKDPKTHPEAISSLLRVTHLAGKSIPDAYFFLASLYSKQGLYAEAAEALEAYLDALPNADAAQRAQYQKAIQQLRQKASLKAAKP